LKLNTERHEYQGNWAECAPVEYLLPRLEKDITLEEIPFIRNRQPNPAWPKPRLRRKIQALGHWEYYFAFEHGLDTRLSASFNERTIDFHRYRSRLISETVMELLGAAAGTATVLDMACHCGLFAMDLAARGIGYARGVDIRSKNITQARFLSDYYGIENVSFERNDVFRLGKQPERYDVVLCLGLLYHVTQPVQLLELCQRLAKQLVVIDTLCHKQPIPAYIPVIGKNTAVAIEGTRSIELQPTYRGVLATFEDLGLTPVVEVTGHCEKEIDLYSRVSRRCFIWRVPEA
jgi:tRNA (mo5U34)-methyltransferase